MNSTFISCLLAQGYGNGFDPGLEEAAHNDDSARENTEKCWEGKSRKANEEKCMSLYCGQGRDRGNFCGNGGGRGDWEVWVQLYSEGWGDVIVDICPELWLSGLGGGGFYNLRFCSISAMVSCGKTPTVWTIILYIKDFQNSPEIPGLSSVVDQGWLHEISLLCSGLFYSVCSISSPPTPQPV